MILNLKVHTVRLQPPDCPSLTPPPFPFLILDVPDVCFKVLTFTHSFSVLNNKYNFFSGVLLQIHDADSKNAKSANPVAVCKLANHCRTK